MAKIGNEAKLILKLARQKHSELKKARIQTPDSQYKTGYERCFEDVWMIIDEIIREIES